MSSFRLYRVSGNTLHEDTYVERVETFLYSTYRVVMATLWKVYRQYVLSKEGIFIDRELRNSRGRSSDGVLFILDRSYVDDKQRQDFDLRLTTIRPSGRASYLVRITLLQCCVRTKNVSRALVPLRCTEFTENSYEDCPPFAKPKFVSSK